MEPLSLPLKNGHQVPPLSRLIPQEDIYFAYIHYFWYGKMPEVIAPPVAYQSELFPGSKVTWSPRGGPRYLYHVIGNVVSSQKAHHLPSKICEYRMSKPISLRDFHILIPFFLRLDTTRPTLSNEPTTKVIGQAVAESEVYLQNVRSFCAGEISELISLQDEHSLIPFFFGLESTR